MTNKRNAKYLGDYSRFLINAIREITKLPPLSYPHAGADGKPPPRSRRSQEIRLAKRNFSFGISTVRRAPILMAVSNGSETVEMSRHRGV